mgnify:FL=1
MKLFETSVQPKKSLQTPKYRFNGIIKNSKAIFQWTISVKSLPKKMVRLLVFHVNFGRIEMILGKLFNHDRCCSAVIPFASSIRFGTHLK